VESLTKERDEALEDKDHFKRKHDQAERVLRDGKHALRTREDYDFRCQDCGAPHNLDTSIPSPIWNAICDNRPGDVPGAAGIGMPVAGALCTLCIDDRLVKAGLTCDVAEFYFGGKALSSRNYAEDTGTIDYLKRELQAARAEATKAESLFRAARERLAEDPHCPVCLARLVAIGQMRALISEGKRWVVFECKCGKWESPIPHDTYVNLDTLAAIRAPRPAEPLEAEPPCPVCNKPYVEATFNHRGLNGDNPDDWQYGWSCSEGPSSPTPPSEEPRCPTHNCGWLSRYRCGCSICEITKCPACIDAERDPPLDALDTPAHSKLCDWTAAHGRLRAGDGCVPDCPFPLSPPPPSEEPPWWSSMKHKRFWQTLDDRLGRPRSREVFDRLPQIACEIEVAIDVLLPVPSPEPPREEPR
jgi:hypothetical protein